LSAFIEPPYQRPLHPLHGFFLAGTVTLFLGALLSDLAYATSYQVQWTNFASWLIFAGLLFGAVVLVFALVGLRHAYRRQGRYFLYGFFLLTAGALGFVNALLHAKDAWAVMPGGLVLSAVVLLLLCVAAWIGLFNLRRGAVS
jgi:uncharacterized membrane protein